MRPRFWRRMGKHAEAEQRYKEVIEKAAAAASTARTARLGMAEAQVAQGKFDSAIAIYTELSRDTSSTMPLDSVLMHLGRAYARAGKKEEAVRVLHPRRRRVPAVGLRGRCPPRDGRGEEDPRPSSPGAARSTRRPMPADLRSGSTAAAARIRWARRCAGWRRRPGRSPRARSTCAAPPADPLRVSRRAVDLEVDDPIQRNRRSARGTRR